MDDILSQGEDREPSPWPRRLAVIAALIAVVAGGAVYLARPGPRPAEATSHPTSATASRPPLQTGPDVLSLPPEPSGIAGPTLAWDRSLRLPASGAQPAWFSPASGRSERIAGLPADRFGYQFTRVVGGWAVQASAAPPAGCGGCAGSPAPVWFLADGGHSVSRVGTASLVAPAATAGAVWLTSYPPGVSMTSAAGTAWEASSRGPLTRPVRLPGGYLIDQGTDHGLLLAPLGLPPGAAAYKLWDPSAPRASRTFTRVLAASPGEVAWTSACALTCSVRTLNLATGKQAAVALPAGSAASSGTFSPDGRFLALQVSFGNSGDGGELSTQLEVAPAGGSRLTIVPGTGASSDALVGFGWPAGADSLVVELSFTTKTQLASWDPGASHPAVADIRRGGSQPSLVLG
ncbi:MAG TPA: hypothetical protein VMG38_12435 [Trebonia sp.]|nr:hypothetical protein [Trebonia sp.]